MFIENPCKTKGNTKGNTNGTSIRSLKIQTDDFTFQYSNDATRRDDKFGSKKIKSVDKGFKEIKLHSETSFSTNRPEIIWFYCKNEAEKDGQTTICDGMKLWELFDFNLKNFFLKNPIKYKLKIPIPGMKAQNKKKKKWILSSLGTFDAEYNYRKNQIEFSLLRFAVTESRIPDKLCFANHLMIDLNSEPQILSRTNQTQPKLCITARIRESQQLFLHQSRCHGIN